MDILLLRTFVTVADTGSFSAAANRLHCVQPNVTARIRRLEDHLGQPLFLRGKGGATLTDLGHYLKGAADDLIAQFDALERDALDAAGALAPLRLGAMESTAAVRLPTILKRLKGLFPKAVVSLQTGPTGPLLTRIVQRQLDAAFVAGPVDDARFQTIPAFHETLVRVVPALGKPDPRFIAFRQGCSYRAVGEAWLRASGRGDTEILEMGTLDGILGCVESGLGFAIVPEAATRRYCEAGALTAEALPARFAQTITSLVWRSDHRPTKTHLKLCDLLLG